jgi:hypothetical protein
MVMANSGNEEEFGHNESFGQAVFKNRTIQQADVSLIENCAQQSDFKLGGFLSNDSLELYFDIYHHDKSVCYIYKGWKDPGFRLGNLVNLKKNHGHFREALDSISKICSKYMLTQSCSEKPDEGYLSVIFEMGIYDGGLNQSVFNEVAKNFEAAVAEIQTLVSTD